MPHSKDTLGLLSYQLTYHCKSQRDVLFRTWAYWNSQRTRTYFLLAHTSYFSNKSWEYRGVFTFEISGILFFWGGVSCLWLIVLSNKSSLNHSTNHRFTFCSHNFGFALALTKLTHSFTCQQDESQSTLRRRCCLHGVVCMWLPWWWSSRRYPSCSRSCPSWRYPTYECSNKQHRLTFVLFFVHWDNMIEQWWYFEAGLPFSTFTSDAGIKMNRLFWVPSSLQYQR